MSSSNINPILLDAKWSIDCKLWQVTVENPAVSGRRVKWTRFRGPIASMRQTSRLMVDGEKTAVILFRTTDQDDDAPEIAGRLSNFVVTKVSPATVRKAIGKKTGVALARKFMHMIVLCVIVFRVCIGFVCKSFKTWLKEQQVESGSGSDFDEDLEMEREEQNSLGLMIPFLATSIIPLEKIAHDAIPIEATIIMVLKERALEPTAELRKFTASLLTPTIRSAMAKAANATSISKYKLSIVFIYKA